MSSLYDGIFFAALLHLGTYHQLMTMKTRLVPGVMILLGMMMLTLLDILTLLVMAMVLHHLDLPVILTLAMLLAELLMAMQPWQQKVIIQLKMITVLLVNIRATRMAFLSQLGKTDKALALALKRLNNVLEDP